MDKDFARKAKTKKIRTIAIVAIFAAVAIAAIFAFKIEKADYGESLKETISEAETLSKEAQKNSGNKEGEYADYTILAFNLQIEEAKKVAEDKDSSYDAKKEAYKSLDDNIGTFRSNANSDAVSSKTVQGLIDDSKSKTYETTASTDTKVNYTIDGSKITKALDINLMSSEEGPYTTDLKDYLKKLDVKGQVISLYQNGSFGGDVTITVPLEDEKQEAGYVYRFDTATYTFTFIGEAAIGKSSDASFDVNLGGDYILLKEKVDEEKVSEIIAEVNEEKAASGAVTPATTATEGHESGVKTNSTSNPSSTGSSGSSSSGGSSSGSTGSGSGSSSGGSSSGSTSNQNKIAVTISIRNDTYSGKSAGTIMGSTTYYVAEGATVYDLLTAICKDKGIPVAHKGSGSSAYIQGINGLYEFDGGTNSGWMYYVNGSKPNYGCGAYKLEEGDDVEWKYTCDLGNDL